MELLAGQRFTVASYGIAAAYTAWLLGQFGADVQHTTALDPEAIGAFLGEGATFEAAPALQPAPGATFITDAPVTSQNRQRLRSARTTRQSHLDYPMAVSKRMD